MTDIKILEDFAGPGGWDQGVRILASLGDPDAARARILGREVDKDAVAVARAAGHTRKLCSVLDDNPSQYVGAEGYIASPPCQTFSTAGSGAGRAALQHLAKAAHLVAYGALPKDAIAAVHDETLDERSVLVLEPLRVIVATRPAWVALEQVPTALPIWRVFVDILRDLGYAARAEVLNAEEYGLGQTRRRAILVAVRKDVMKARNLTEVPWAVKTHSKFHVRNNDRIDEGYPRWVSMYEALQWGMTERPSMTVTGGGTGAGGAEVFGNGARQGMRRELEAGRFVMRSNYGTNGDSSNRGERTDDQPAPTITSKVGRNKFVAMGDVRQSRGTVRPIDQPSPTLTGAMDNGNFQWVPEFNDQSGTPFDPDWPTKRPATVVAGRGLVQNPGATANRYNGSTKSRNDGVKVTVQEAGILQSFPADYPWAAAGTITSQYQRVGDAMPPLLAAAVLAPVFALYSKEA